MIAFNKCPEKVFFNSTYFHDKFEDLHKKNILALNQACAFSVKCFAKHPCQKSLKKAVSSHKEPLLHSAFSSHVHIKHFFSYYTPPGHFNIKKKSRATQCLRA